MRNGEKEEGIGINNSERAKRQEKKNEAKQREVIIKRTKGGAIINREKKREIEKGKIKEKRGKRGETEERGGNGAATFSLSTTTACTSPKAAKCSFRSSAAVPRAKPLTKRLRSCWELRSARRLRRRRCFLPRR